MNNTLKVLAAVAAFSIFILAAVYAYNTLGKGGLSPDNPDEGGQTGEGATPEGSDAEGEKERAPDFTVYDASGKPVKLSDLLGEPVVLNFWASWCPPCRSEMPLFDELHRKEGGTIILMMVDLADGRRETVEKGAAYIREEGFAFPVYFDRELEAARNYGISSIPQTFFIDREGYIIARVSGAVDARTLQEGISAIR